MDNLCHTLAGAALGEAGLKTRTSRGMATLMIASNFPDIDVAVFLTDTLAMSFRRGWTHGVLAMGALPVALASAIWLWDRWRAPKTGDAARPPARFAGLLLLSCIGNWLHVLMDFLNSYGVRLLMPFSERWFYGDALYIVEPVLYVTLGAAVLAARGWGSARTSSFRPARIGVAIAAAYMAAMFVSNVWARSVVRDGLSRAGRPAGTRFMVTPVFGNPFRREVIVDVGDRYEKGFLWFEPAPRFRPAGYGVETNLTHPDGKAAAGVPRAAAFLRWSRFPFFVIDETSGRRRIFLNDYRYSGPSGREGWATQEIGLPGAAVSQEEVPRSGVPRAWDLEVPGLQETRRRRWGFRTSTLRHHETSNLASQSPQTRNPKSQPRNSATRNLLFAQLE